MKLGKRQTAWVEALEAHPERQKIKKLGDGTARAYKACCLGEACVVKSRRLSKPFPITSGEEIADGNGQCTGVLSEGGHTQSYFGFIGASGGTANGIAILGKATKNGDRISSLAQANDNGISWTEIATAVRNNPENFFTESK